MNREQVCPHSYCEEEELRLEIDCSACPGAQDIRNGRCLSGMMHILCSEAVPQTVILKRHIHKRYRESALGRAFFAARLLSTLNRAIANPDPASDRRCRTCSASIPRTALALRQVLLDDPIRYMDSRSPISANLPGNVAGAACERGVKCVDDALALGGARYDQE